MGYKQISPQVVVEGGTGVSSTTVYAVLCGGTTTTGAIQSIASVGTSGQVLTSNGAAALPTFQAVPSPFTWNVETGTSATMAVNNGYISNNASTVTFTLPSSAAVGDIIRVSGIGAGGWAVAQNAGQTIHFGNQSSTTGVTGSLASTHDRDSIYLVCVVADDDFNILSSIGNITVT